MRGQLSLNASKVSFSSDAGICDTCNGTDYTVKVVQNNRGHSSMALFDCYMNGEFLEGVTFRVDSESRIHLDMFVADGCKLYINAAR